MSKKSEVKYYCWQCFKYGHKTVECSGPNPPPNGAELVVSLKPVKMEAVDEDQSTQFDPQYHANTFNAVEQPDSEAQDSDFLSGGALFGLYRNPQVAAVVDEDVALIDRAVRDAEKGEESIDEHGLTLKDAIAVRDIDLNEPLDGEPSLKRRRSVDTLEHSERRDVKKPKCMSLEEVDALFFSSEDDELNREPTANHDSKYEDASNHPPNYSTLPPNSGAPSIYDEMIQGEEAVLLVEAQVSRNTTDAGNEKETQGHPAEEKYTPLIGKIYKDNSESRNRSRLRQRLRYHRLKSQRDPDISGMQRRYKANDNCSDEFLTLDRDPKMNARVWKEGTKINWNRRVKFEWKGVIWVVASSRDVRMTDFGKDQWTKVQGRCEGCEGLFGEEEGCVGRPLWDHCHRDGWFRAVFCNSCNMVANHHFSKAMKKIFEILRRSCDRKCSDEYNRQRKK